MPLHEPCHCSQLDTYRRARVIVTSAGLRCLVRRQVNAIGEMKFYGCD
jgi:hypothetical protein